MVNDPYINSTKLFLPVKLYFRVLPSNEQAPTRLTMFEWRPTFLRISNSWIRPMRCFSSVLSVKKNFKKSKKKQNFSASKIHEEFAFFPQYRLFNMVNQQKSFIATNRLHCVRKIGLLGACDQNTQLIVQAVNDNAQRSYTEGFNRTHHGFLNNKKSSKSQQKVVKKS